MKDYGLNDDPALRELVDWDRAKSDPSYRARVDRAYSKEYGDRSPQPVDEVHQPRKKPFAHIVNSDGDETPPGSLID